MPRRWGGHRLQTEISEPHLLPLGVGKGGGRGGRKTINTGWNMDEIIKNAKMGTHS